MISLFLKTLLQNNTFKNMENLIQFKFTVKSIKIISNYFFK